VRKPAAAEPFYSKPPVLMMSPMRVPAKNAHTGSTASLIPERNEALTQQLRLAQQAQGKQPRTNVRWRKKKTGAGIDMSGKLQLRPER
jgi:hypothetical protein